MESFIKPQVQIATFKFASNQLNFEIFGMFSRFNAFTSSHLSLKQIFRSDYVVDVAPMPGVGDALHSNHSEADGFALADTFRETFQTTHKRAPQTDALSTLIIEKSFTPLRFFLETNRFRC